ncbi:MAG: hypothetical protein NVSMB46_05710 [Candidatus Saccharimonadales bacterium]
MSHVLIVEDDKTLNQAYEMILKKEGHNVSVAFDGQEALAIAKKVNPSIILLDLLMPIMNGLEFLEQYDLLNTHPEVKVVILSNLGNEKEVEKAMDLGAYKYIIKAHATPIQLSMLVNALINKNIEKKLVG